MRSRKDESGFTLAEMLVTIMLFSVLGTILMNVLITSMKTQTRSIERTTALNDAKRALERSAADIRGANPLLVAETRRIKFVVTLNGVQTTSMYALSSDGTKLQVTSEKKTLATGAATSPVTKTALSGLTLGPTAAAFTYHNESDVPLAPTVVGGSAYDTSEVALVGISLPVKLPIDNEVVRLDQQVSLRNQEG